MLADLSMKETAVFSSSLNNSHQNRPTFHITPDYRLCEHGIILRSRIYTVSRQVAVNMNVQTPASLKLRLCNIQRFLSKNLIGFRILHKIIASCRNKNSRGVLHHVLVSVAGDASLGMGAPYCPLQSEQDEECVTVVAAMGA